MKRPNLRGPNSIEAKYNGNDIINTVRGTLWLNGKYHLFKSKVILTHESYFQPSLEDSDNFRWSADIGLEFPVWKFLNFKNQLPAH